MSAVPSSKRNSHLSNWEIALVCVLCFFYEFGSSWVKTVTILFSRHSGWQGSIVWNGKQMMQQTLARSTGSIRARWQSVVVCGLTVLDVKHETCTWKTKTHRLVGFAKRNIGIWHCKKSENIRKNVSPLRH